jgi:Mrp family chromosome partitioning ATPase
MPAYISALLQWMWLMVLCAVVAGGAAYTFSKLQQPVYRASALLVVDESHSGQDVYNSFLASEQFATMYTQLATQPIVLAQAARALGHTSASALADQITTASTSGSPVFEIRADATSPTQAAKSANSVADALVSVVNQQGPGDTNILHVFQPAVPPSAPNHPKALLNAAVGAALGFVLAGIFVLLMETVRERVRSAKQIEQRTGLPTIGAVPDLSTSDPLAAWREDEHLRESFRMLRANLYSRPDQTLRVLAVTSAEPDEGKTLVATELAIALARSGKRVLLIDSDLHHPSVHDRLGIPLDPGLATYLEGGDLEPHLTAVADLPNLWIVPAGTAGEHTTESLGGERMQVLLGHLQGNRDGDAAHVPMSRRASFAGRQQSKLHDGQHDGHEEIKTPDSAQTARDADVIVLDTPPLLAFADAAILSAEADGVLVVADTIQSRLSALNEAQQVLQRVGARALGVVLNRATVMGPREYYRVGARTNADTALPQAVGAPADE